MTGGYNPEHFANLRAVEDRHFWFRARNQVIRRLAARAVAGLPGGYRVLEAGCGDGNVLRFLEEACPNGVVVGMDYFAEGLRFARDRSSCALVQGDLTQPPFSKPFQLIGIFDVLEHLADDRHVLRDVWQLLDRQGTLLLTVPFGQALWSAFDEASGHCRRYEVDELAGKMREAGFTIEFLTPYMASIYPLVRLSRGLFRGARKDDPTDAVTRELRIIPGLNGILSWVLSQEARWIGGHRPLPFGTSLLAVARKG